MTIESSDNKIGLAIPFEPSLESQQLFRLMWQLESWLREMVYVELRAKTAAWDQKIISSTGKNWPPRSMTSDKRLRHMTTAHQGAISYLTLGELQKVIFENWQLFESYFPPQEIFKARLEEISQIRHRVAHFRSPHKNDVDRAKLFLRDIDPGIWRFCSTYGQQQVQIGDISDTVSDHFAQSFTRHHGVDLHTSDRKWHCTDTHNPAMGVGLRFGTRPWVNEQIFTIVGAAGIVYMVEFRALRGHDIDFGSFLDRSQTVHEHCIHIRISRGLSGRVDVSIPSVLGEEVLRNTITTLWSSCREAVFISSPANSIDIEVIVQQWPEYIIGPSNPLLFVDSTMPSPMFELD